jgi:hypothetical protein
MEPFRWNGFNLEGGKEVNVKHRGTNKIPESLIRVFRTGCEVIKESSFRTN